jgi:hypothetical protein
MGPRGAVPFFSGRVPTVMITPTVESDELNPFALFTGNPSASFRLGDDEDEEFDDDDDDLDDEDDDDLDDEDEDDDE